MVPILEEILRTNSVRSIDGTATIPLRDAVTGEIGTLLQRLIREKCPALTLEIGLAFGVSALFICEALASVGGRQHIVIDAFQTSVWNGIGMHNVRAAGFGQLVQLREQLSEDALPLLSQEGTKVDFAFIDGTHSFDQKMVDFFYVDRILNVGGIIAFDDCNWPSIRQVCRFIATNRPYRVVGATAGGGMPGIRGNSIRWAARHYDNVRQIVKPKFFRPDEEFGIPPHSRCVAFEKLADYTVKPDYVFTEF
jgi:predicted O-methyltransferase YrrM